MQNITTIFRREFGAYFNSPIAYIFIIAFLVLTVLRARQGKKTRGTVTGIIVAVVAAIILNTVSAGLVFIEPQERGVVFSAIAPKGYREAILQPGLRWVGKQPDLRRVQEGRKAGPW